MDPNIPLSLQPRDQHVQTIIRKLFPQLGSLLVGMRKVGSRVVLFAPAAAAIA